MHNPRGDMHRMTACGHQQRPSAAPQHVSSPHVVGNARCNASSPVNAWANTCTWGALQGLGRSPAGPLRRLSGSAVVESVASWPPITEAAAAVCITTVITAELRAMGREGPHVDGIANLKSSISSISDSQSCMSPI